MNRFVLRLPQDLYQRVQQEAARQGVSINQYLMYNITRAVTAQEAHTFFQGKASGADQAKALELLDRVADRAPLNNDDLLPGEYRQARRRTTPIARRTPTSPASRKAPKPRTSSL